MSAPQTLIPLANETATQRFAAAMADILEPGDSLLLEGEIGAGKSAFARALIRSVAGAEIEVPSPTFTLVQTYAFDTFEIWHCDLYRLGHPDDVLELGLDAAFETAICLIEWPDRLGDLTPSGALTLRFAALQDHHTVTFQPDQNWAARLAHLNV